MFRLPPLLLLLLPLLLGSIRGDLPVHCLHSQVAGDWEFRLSSLTYTKTVNCSLPQNQTPTHVLRLKLSDPSDALDLTTKARGFWTMVYDQGVEVDLSGYKFFAFSRYEQQTIPFPNGTTAIKTLSHCGLVGPGWYHTEDGTRWGCFLGYKVNHSPHSGHITQGPTEGLYIPDPGVVTQWNAAQSSWKAGVYPWMKSRPMSELQAMGGTPLGDTSHKSRALEDPRSDEEKYAGLPHEWDWRNVQGISYDTPVRAQGACGSCYAFATLSMLESRIRIQTRNRLRPLLSSQHVLSCDPYAQACAGGFPYLVGKFGEDYGFVTEDCFPYEGENLSCDMTCRDPNKIVRATNSRYVGGYYGGTNEVAMMREIYEKGPIAVAFEVDLSFYHYVEGIYHELEGEPSTFDSQGFQKTNHGVTVVGWGSSPETGEKYWIVKNTWGPDWGEGGYFRIARGVDECAFESMAFALDPLLEAFSPSFHDEQNVWQEIGPTMDPEIRSDSSATDR